jgi:MscS family membrane protein
VFQVATAVALPGIREIGLSIELTRSLSFVVKLVVVASVVVVAFRLVDVFTGYLAGKAETTDTKLDDQLVPLIRKATKVALTLIATLFILQNLDVDVGSLLAGLGLGGLAFALAAKDTLANLFGSFTIFLDRPFQIGDWVIVGGVEGTVEEVGFRSTRVRTFYKSVVTVPNSKIADSVVDNMGIRSFRRFKVMLGLTYDTPPDKVQAYVEGVRAILHANPMVWQDYFEVHFNRMSASSLDVLVYAFLDVTTWTDELSQRHNMLLEFMRLADTLGVSFAFPTQSLHIESQRAEMPESTLLSRGELEKIVHSFGPGGELSDAGGRQLTDGGYYPKTTAARGSDSGE